MNHLTNEQLEDIMQGQKLDLTHLNQCRLCQDRLKENRAVAAKLRSAFMAVKPDDYLAGRILSQIQNHENTKAAKSIRLRWATHFHRKLWPVLAAAAVILIVLAPLSLYVLTPSTATAAQAELAMIHQQNLGSHREFYNDSDPEKLAQYFKDKLGFVPAFPCTGNGMEIRGCCIAHFKGSIAGSYIVDTPKGIISVIVVTDTPKQLGMNMMNNKGYEQDFWQSSYAQCNMATVRLGDYSYCAIGEVSKISHEYLGDLLSRLLPDIQ